MLLASHWETIVDMTVFFETIHERYLYIFAFTALHESVWVSNQDKRIASTRKHDVDSLRSRHEPDVSNSVAACEADDDNFAFFALVVVCTCQFLKSRGVRGDIVYSRQSQVITYQLLKCGAFVLRHSQQLAREAQHE